MLAETQLSKDIYVISNGERINAKIVFYTDGRIKKEEKVGI